jgi:DMSO/TMAO reductase YedYZ molybdopterin-dependent catalytic subunit
MSLARVAGGRSFVVPGDGESAVTAAAPTAMRRRLSHGYRQGLLAMAPAVIVSSLPSLIFNWPWALEPVTEQVMLATPVDLAQQLLIHLGPSARPLALLGGFAVYLLLGAAAAVVAALPRGRVAQAAYPGLAMVLLLLAVFFLFAPRDWGPVLLLGAAYFLLLAWPRRPGHATASEGEPASRRRFLADSTRIVGAAAVLTAALLVEPWYKSLTVYQRGGRLFAFRPPKPRQPGFNLPDLTPELTAVPSFYHMSKNLVDPDQTTSEWSLRLDGLVRRPYAYTYDALLALPSVSQYVTQECVSNPVGGNLISCALFTGVPLRDLLAAAGPLPAAAKLVMRGADGLADSIPLDLALDPMVVLAYGMNGQYLQRNHGYPARILIPGSYGFKGIKWVTHLELVSHQFTGTWQEQGWTENGLVASTTRIDLVRPESEGALVAGVAFAGATGVRGVQVRGNGGPWIEATLHAPPLSRLTWVQWRARLPMRGTITVEARLIDGAGRPQEARQRDIYPAGATGYHRLTVHV